MEERDRFDTPKQNVLSLRLARAVASKGTQFTCILRKRTSLEQQQLVLKKVTLKRHDVWALGAPLR